MASSGTRRRRRGVGTQWLHALVLRGSRARDQIRRIVRRCASISCPWAPLRAWRVPQEPEPFRASQPGRPVGPCVASVWREPVLGSRDARSGPAWRACGGNPFSAAGTPGRALRGERVAGTRSRLSPARHSPVPQSRSWIQCRTGTDAAVARWAKQPMFAVAITSAWWAWRFPILRDSSSRESSGCRME